MGTKVMKKELNYLASKRLEKVGRQELHLTSYKQEMGPCSFSQPVIWGYTKNSSADNL
jgi:hypothetical protein